MSGRAAAAASRQFVTLLGSDAMSDMTPKCAA